MGVILHLSDLHLLSSETAIQERVLSALVDAIRRDREHRGRVVDLIVITGDVFDCATLDLARSARAFRTLLGELVAATGDDPPTVVVPGNHDRRSSGLVGPQRPQLFQALANAGIPRLHVHGTDPHFLAASIPHEVHGMPIALVAYDSTWLPGGLLGAGGTLRQEDLLQAASAIADVDPDWPVVLLQHHHLVPTPLTDCDPIDAGRSRFLKWGVEGLLPRLVAHADREEWMVAALGAGTALSTLHSLGRAVLVLHGHKHNPTARVLVGTKESEGDVMIASAGSAGTSQSVRQSSSRRSARIWPSFNVVELDRESIHVEAIGFAFRGPNRRDVDYRSLVFAARSGARWEVAPAPASKGVGALLEEDSSAVTLAPAGNRWSLDCVRTLAPGPDLPPHYIESIDGPAGASVVVDGLEHSLPHRLELGFEAREYRIHSAVPRTVDEARRLASEAAPFGSVEHLVRYRTRMARLSLHGPDSLLASTFASVSDIGSGLEHPVRLEREDRRVVLTLPNAAARSLLRIYWPLEVASRESTGMRNLALAVG